MHTIPDLVGDSAVLASGVPWCHLVPKPQPDFITSSANGLKPTKSKRYRQQNQPIWSNYNFTDDFSWFYASCGKQDALTSQSASFDGFTAAAPWMRVIVTWSKLLSFFLPSVSLFAILCCTFWYRRHCLNLDVFGSKCPLAGGYPKEIQRIRWRSLQEVKICTVHARGYHRVTKYLQ